VSAREAGAGIRDAKARAVRVFISSTFVDMQDEREELVKRVFPTLRLRELCESRGVSWGEVDLRWGITDEQTAEGRVLPICLEEIRSCRPYFIGILGERYGWVLERIDASLIEQEPWLAEHVEKSITELEIIHGVLADPEMAEQAFFYFRDPRYAVRGPELQERPSAAEIEQFGPREAELRARVRRQRLAALKKRIRASGLPVRDDYPDPEALGELVRRDLTAVVDRLFPAGSEPTPLGRERALHDAFARSRAGLWIGRGEDLERLDEHVAAAGEPMVLTGESGVGKSALLANWALRFEDRRERRVVADKSMMPGTSAESFTPDTFLVTHFIAASPASADWAAMLRRLIAELAGFYEFEIKVPDDPPGLREAFADALRQAATRGRVVLLIDALDQLEDHDGAPDLVWIPAIVPANIRLILSSLTGRPLAEITRRGWSNYQLAPLTEVEREQLIVEYLGQYRKSLPTSTRRQIAGSSRAANPLFLRVLLEELRLYGEHHTLEQRLRELLAAPDIPRLYQLVLARWEQDYERHRPGLVGDAMTLLWAARRGLSEPELLDLVGDSEGPLPPAIWSPLALAAKQTLTNCGGLNGFAHAYARTAVQERYMPGESQRQRAHERLADYFGKLEAQTPRKLEELPWQLAQAARWRQLHDLLAETDFMSALAQSVPFELRGYWAQVEAASPYRLVEAYASVIEHPARYKKHELAVIVQLFIDTGYWPDALRIARHLEQLARDDSDELLLGLSLDLQAVIADHQGDLKRALELSKETEGLVRRAGDPLAIAQVLNNQAVTLKRLGDLGGALELHREAEQICRQHSDLSGLAASLTNQALIARRRGDNAGALQLHREAERVYREAGDTAGLARSLANQALLLSDTRDNAAALASLTEAEQLYRELADPAGIGRCIGNRALILQRQGDIDEAIALHEQEEAIWRELGDAGGLASALGNRAVMLVAHLPRDDKAALAVLNEAEEMWRRVGDPDGIAKMTGLRAELLREMGDSEGAVAAREDEVQLYRQLGQPLQLINSLCRDATMREKRGEFARAYELFREAERVAREHNNPAWLREPLVGRTAPRTGGGDQGSGPRRSAEDLPRGRADRPRA
jgi:nephrocystin-3